jgi:WD40 repeat protein
MAGNLLVTANKDGAISTWDLIKGQERQRLKGHSRRIKQLKIKGYFLASMDETGIVKTWDLNAGRRRQTYPAGKDKGWHRELLSSGEKIIGADVKNQTLRCWDIETGTLIQEIIIPEGRFGRLELVRDILISGGGQKGDPIRCWSLSTGRPLPDLQAPLSEINYLQASGNIVVGTNSSTYENLAIWDLPSGERRHTLPDGAARDAHCRGITQVAFKDNILVSAGRTFSDGHYDDGQGYMNVMVYWDIITGEARQVFKGHQGAIKSVEIAGCLLISGSEDGVVKFWDLKTGTLIWNLFTEGPLSSLKYNLALGILVVTGSRGRFHFIK